jgi:hypothetical protein
MGLTFNLTSCQLKCTFASATLSLNMKYAVPWRQAQKRWATFRNVLMSRPAAASAQIVRAKYLQTNGARREYGASNPASHLSRATGCARPSESYGFFMSALLRLHARLIRIGNNYSLLRDITARKLKPVESSF